MRNTNELNVDATRHAIRAEERTRANGRLHRVFDQPEAQAAKADSWWHKYFKWETLTVAGRTIEKGFVVSPFLAGLFTAVVGVLLAAVLTIGGTIYWRLSDRIDKQREEAAVAARENRDLMIRLDERLINKNVTDREKDEKLEKRLQLIDASQIALARDIVKAQR